MISSLVWLWWVIDLARFEFKSRTFPWFYPTIFCSCGESRLLVSWCVDGRCGMTGSDEDRGRSRRPGAEDRRWLHRLDTQWPDDWEVKWWCVRSAPCTKRWGAQVFWLSLKTKVEGLSLVWPQNHWDGFLWFGLKTGDDGFLRFGLKTGGSSFSVLASKLAAMVWWFVHQNHHDSFLVWALKPNGRWFIGCASKPMRGWRRRRTHFEISDLLHVEANQDRVFQSGLKTDRSVTAGDGNLTSLTVRLIWDSALASLV
jgi:hypothetical protein